MPKKTELMKDPDQVDTLKEFAEIKVEIKERVIALGVTAKFPVDGCRNYHLEADGTLWMQYGPIKRATNQWKSDDWDRFFDDVKRGLWARLSARFSTE